MKAMLPEVFVSFRYAQPSLPSLDVQFHDLWRFVKELRQASPLWEHWLLGGDTKAEALLYDAFDADGPTTAALAVLRTKNKGIEDVRSIGIWNGKEGQKGASILAFTSTLGSANSVRFNWTVEPSLTWQQAATLLETAIKIWSPRAVQFGPQWYDEHKVFTDRLGVSWMLYLPRKLTANQVPEARALVPVMEGKEQTGTIIVSVTDAPFDLDNPEHIAVANAIEVRLVDQDLLPLYREL